MSPRIGVIADDLTGATDIASFLVKAGLSTVQINSSVVAADLPDVHAVVIGLKTRSIPADQAIQHSLAAVKALKNMGAEHIIFKYCSTFDSTSAGNIGPVTDALLKELDSDFTVVVPALPVNGRTVYSGNLFVHGEPLHESGMRNHPITPMRDSNLMRLMDAQSQGTTGLVAYETIEKGVDAVRERLAHIRAEGASYAVIDTLTHSHLHTIGEAVRDMPLITGGSGIGEGLGRAVARQQTHADQAHTDPSPADVWSLSEGLAVVLSGSASDMTNTQVARYQQHAPHQLVDVEEVLTDSADYVQRTADWVVSQDQDIAPMVYATAPADQVKVLQQRHGAEHLSSAIETFFGQLAIALRERGFTRFITAGGETSGAVTQALRVDGFQVGPQIAAGVPWVKSLDGRLDLALKSGNFGDEDFFSTAQHTVTDRQER